MARRIEVRLSRLEASKSKEADREPMADGDLVPRLGRLLAVVEARPELVELDPDDSDDVLLQKVRVREIVAMVGDEPGRPERSIFFKVAQ